MRIEKRADAGSAAEPELARLDTRRSTLTVLGAFLFSRVLICLIGVGAIAAREDVLGASFFSGRVWRSLGNSFAAWDGDWYIAAATRGYGAAGINPDGQSTAPFFPLLPAMIKGLGYLGVPPVAAGLLIANSAFFVALLLLYRIGFGKGGESMARRSVWIAALSPFGFAFSMIYPDGIFMAASIGAFLLAREGRWGLAAGACIPAALVRPNGFVLAIAVGFAAWAAGGQLKDKLLRMLPLGAVAVAVAAWLAALARLSGSAFAFVTAKSAWEELAIWDAIPATYHLLTGAAGGRPLPAAAIVHLAIAAGGVYLLVAGRKIFDRGWGLLCLLVMIGPAILGIIGLARYMAALFPVYLAFANLVNEGSRVERWLLYGGGVATTVIVTGVFWGRLVP